MSGRAPEGPARRWFRPHLGVYFLATLGGITAAFAGAGPPFPIFAALSLWGLGVALHGYLAVVGTDGAEDEGP